MTDVLLGCDVSEWQVVVDWPRVRASGVTFALARVSYGAAYPDRYYAANRVGIPAAGLIPGGYHFLTPGGDAGAQADLFCNLADPAALHALDVERAGLDVEGWVARYRVHHPTHPLIVYTGRDLWRAAAGELNGGTIGPLWLAGTVPNGYVPGAGSLPGLWAEAGPGPYGALPWGGWRAAALVQFTESGRVPGITTPVDGDAFFGTAADLHALTGAADMPLTDAEWTRLGSLIDARIAAALPDIAKATQSYYEVHTPGGLVSLDTAVAEVLAAVTGLTPAAVAAAARAAPVGSGATLDVTALTAAIRAAVADVLLHGAAR